MINYLSAETKEHVYIGYGTRDDDFNEFAQMLSSRLSLSNKNLRIEKFNANHLELPSIALIGGLQFMFREYKNFDDFIEKVSANNFDISRYVDDYTTRMVDLYGIETGLSPEDYFHFVMSCVKDKNIGAFRKIMKYVEDNKLIELNYHMYFYLNNDLGDIESAKNYAYLMVKSDNENDKRILFANITSYLDMFIEAAKTPLEAISFLETAIKNSPEFKLEFSYFITKIGIENNIEKDKIKNYLNYCKNNYKPNRYFDYEQIINLEGMRSVKTK